MLSCSRVVNDSQEKVQLVKSDSADIHSELSTEDSILSQQIDGFFKKKFQRRLFNGAVLFAKNGKIIHSGAYGYANWRKKEPLMDTSVFQLASVTKPLTAIGILLLLQEGEIKLGDNVDKYISDFPYPNITIKDLLTHRGGLTNYMYFTDKHWPDWDIPISNDEVVSLLKIHQPKVYYPPNKRYNYSNTGYVLLAHIIENVTQMSYSRYMKKKVFEPLGMSKSKVKRYSLGDYKLEKVVGHKKNFRPYNPSYLDGAVGDKGIYSTVGDLFKLDQALYGDSFITKQWKEKAFSAQHRDLKKEDNYGLGWRLNEGDSDNKIVYHRGWWKGFRTYFIRAIDKNYTIILLNNTTYGRFLKNDELLALFEKEKRVSGKKIRKKSKGSRG